MNRYPKLVLTSELTFGRYKGLTIEDIIVKDKSYMIWLLSVYEGTIDQEVHDILNDETEKLPFLEREALNIKKKLTWNDILDKEALERITRPFGPLDY